MPSDSRSDLTLIHAGPARAVAATLADYAELTKARLVALVLVTTAVGFVLADSEPTRWATFGWTLLGTALAGLGANGLNECIERRADSRMARTRNRPLPAGRLPIAVAYSVATAMTILGPVILVIGANVLAALLALSAAAVYLLIYTPLKSRTPLCTLVGAVSGALPPMVGWAAASGRLDAGAWILGGVLFVWQIPHFLALSWLYRDDYARGGFRMLPVVDRQGDLTTLAVVLFSLALVPVALMATWVGVAGWAYAGGSVLLGTALAGLGAVLRRRRSRLNARRVFLASIVYLPFLLGLMLLDRGPIAQVVPHVGAMAVVPAPDPSSL